MTETTTVTEPIVVEEQVRKALQGNICRCTGYWNIVKAVRAASGQEIGE